MECIVHTEIVDGLPIDICNTKQGDLVVRIAGGRIDQPDAHAILKGHGREDVALRFNIQRY